MGRSARGGGLNVGWESLLIGATAVGSAIVGGVLFSFDAFVLRARWLRLPEARGAQAMRPINVSAVRPALIIAIFGTAALAAWGRANRLRMVFAIVAAAVLLAGLTR